MTVPLIAFTDDLRAAIAAQIGKPVNRRYTQYKDAQAVKDGVWFAIMRNEELTKKRLVDSSNFTVDIAYQRSLPEATADKPTPLENSEFIDACMAEVETVKALFRENGALAESINDKWAFLSMSNEPAYQPVILEQLQFISLIRLEFRALQG